VGHFNPLRETPAWGSNHTHPGRRPKKALVAAVTPAKAKGSPKKAPAKGAKKG
jgi:hypothetical protein